MAIKITTEEYKKKFGELPEETTAKQNPDLSGFGGYSITGNIADAFKSGVEQAKSGYQSSLQGVQQAETGNFAKGTYNALSGATKMLAGGIGAALSPLAPVSKVIEPLANYAIENISDIGAVQRFAQSKTGKVTSRLAEDINNLSTIAGSVAGSKTLAGTTGKITGAVDSTLGKIKGILPDGGGGGGMGGAVSTIIKQPIRFIKRIPERVKINAAEINAEQTAIKSLPTKSLQKAAQEGIDVTDLKTITNIPRIERASLNKLFNTVKEFAGGKTKKDPFEVVGKPIVSRLKTIDNQVKGYAVQLDKIATGLKGQTVKNNTGIYKAVQDGLDSMGITVNKKGLNFKGSNLEGIGGSGKIIDNVVKRIGNAKDAFDLHRLKKFIDENVNYGKRVEGISGEAERLLKTWRKAIDDTLDNQFPEYNKVNTKLAERIQPLNDLKNLLKNADGLDEDLLAQKAGILARRITSAAPSNPVIKQILRNVDKFTSVTGKTLLNVERLQDFYNILNKYYDIAPKTGFQNLVKEGIDSASTITGIVGEQVKNLAGKTSKVRQTAFEDAMKEFFNSN